MNWWLVARHLKHGMMTVRKPGTAEAAVSETGGAAERKMMMHAHAVKPSTGTIAAMAVLSTAIFVLGIALSALLGGFR